LTIILRNWVTKYEAVFRRFNKFYKNWYAIQNSMVIKCSLSYNYKLIPLHGLHIVSVCH